MVKRTVTLEIAGTKFRLVSDADETYLHELAAIVNERVENLGGKTSRVTTPTQLLALVALDLADDLRTTEMRENQTIEMTRTVILNAIDRIDRRLAADDRLSNEAEQSV